MVRAQQQRTHHHTPRSGYRQQLLDHAVAYAEAGWPVLPIRPGTKWPAVPNHTANYCTGTDPRCANGHVGWEQRATTDPARITAAWQQRAWGIGIACGPAGLVVIDLDIPADTGTTGAESLRQLEHDHGEQLPGTWTVATPSGGRHLYYQRPAGVRIGNSNKDLGPGIDIRGNGGQVVAPPTRTPAGAYEIIDPTEPAVLPDWFARLLEPPPPDARPARRRPRPVGPSDGAGLDRYVQAAFDAELDRVRGADRGSRNHALFVAAATLGEFVAAGALDRFDVETALEHAATGWYGIPGTDNGEPFTAGEARRTIASGLRHTATKPRQLPTHRTHAGAAR